MPSNTPLGVRLTRLEGESHQAALDRIAIDTAYAASGRYRLDGVAKAIAAAIVTFLSQDPE